MPDGVQVYDGLQMESYLKIHPTVLYRYRANTYGFFALLFLAAVAVGLGLYIWLAAELDSTWNLWAFGLLAATASVAVGLVAYWFYFTKIHYLATSDQDLIIGQGRKLVAIHWSALDADALGFGALNPGQSKAAILSVRLQGTRYRLRLFTRYVCLENLQGFMSTLLQHLRESTEAPSSSP